MMYLGQTTYSCIAIWHRVFTLESCNYEHFKNVILCNREFPLKAHGRQISLTLAKAVLFLMNT